MHYFLIRAKPKPDNQEGKELAGAYVNCWIDFALSDGAELLARHYIEEAGWIPGVKEDERWVEEEDFKDDAELLGYFREAAEDGASFVFNSWPIGGEDEEEAGSILTAGEGNGHECR